LKFCQEGKNIFSVENSGGCKINMIVKKHTSEEKMAEFHEWLEKQMKERGWGVSETANRAGVVPSTISMLLNAQKHPAAETCVALAKAFGEPPEVVLRRAGIMPPVPEQTEEEERLLDLFRSLTPHERQIVLAMLRGLKK
jgi:transcriptional regulator with XRE-family HTH domain